MYMNISEPLPNELIDNIIDHLHGDQPSQQACALVSRTFLTSCRHHLYGRITLCPWERKWDPDFRKGTLMSFFHIAPYITSLTIDWEDGESSYPGDCGVVFDILPVISTHRGVPTLVSLRSLTHSALRLRDGRSKTSSTFIPTLLGSTGTTVKELNFESCTLPSIHILAGVVASCTALEKLTLRHIAWDLVDSSGSSPLPKLPYQLHTFGYHGFYNSHSSILYQWIYSQEPHLVIDPLSLYIGLSELPVISSLIANWGVLLKTLKLDFCWSNPGFAEFSTRDCLLSTTILQSLHIGLPHGIQTNSDEALVCLTRILTPHNLAHSLKNLVIVFSFDPPALQLQHDPSSKWADLKDLLLGFAQLEMVRIKSRHLLGMSNESGLKDLLRPLVSRKLDVQFS